MELHTNDVSDVFIYVCLYLFYCIYVMIQLYLIGWLDSWLVG